MNDVTEIATDQCDRRRFHGDIGASAYGNANVRLRMRGRSVEAVAGHRNDRSLALQASNYIGLVLGQDVGVYLVNGQ